MVIAVRDSGQGMTPPGLAPIDDHQQEAGHAFQIRGNERGRRHERRGNSRRSRTRRDGGLWESVPYIRHSTPLRRSYHYRRALQSVVERVSTEAALAAAREDGCLCGLL